MISAAVTYKNLGLSDEEITVAIACEALAVRLIDAGMPPEMVTERVINFLKNSRKGNGCLAPMSLLRDAYAADAFDKVAAELAAEEVPNEGGKRGEYDR